MSWTETTREYYRREGLTYASSLKDQEWALIEPFMPAARPLGRRRKTDLRAVMNAILYILATGCQWRALPKDFPPRSTVQGYFYGWRDDGTWHCINRALVRRSREAMGRNVTPSAGIIDSQSVKTTESGGPRGFDAAKRVKGRKRHIVTDTAGLMLGLRVLPGNIQDNHGAVPLLHALRRLPSTRLNSGALVGSDFEAMPFAPVEPFALKIGEAILAYAEVERSQATLLSALLSLKHDRANAIFYSIQNIRARNEMIETLLRQQFKEDYSKHWDSCSEFLQKLAKFRNAIAHWHPVMRVYMPKPGKPQRPGENALSNPSPGWGIKSLTLDDIPPFKKDCRAIRRELYEFTEHIQERLRGPTPLPDKFQQPIACRNLAVLQRHRKPKEQTPRPPPSPAKARRGPKQSAKQRRQRALAKRKPS